jgi:ABC-type spermidine/putrescine transport system permease subunit II
MNDINISQLAGGSVVEHDDAFGGVALISQAMMQKIAFVMASVATVVSLGIAVAAGLQRAGTPGEKALSVLLGMLMVFGAICFRSSGGPIVDSCVSAPSRFG